MEAASRDERQLMRKRGAGTRNINNNIELSLSFPTPTVAQRSKVSSPNRRASRRSIKSSVRRSVSQEPTTVIPFLPEASVGSRANKRKSSFLDAAIAGPELSINKNRRLNNATAPLDHGSNNLNAARQSKPRRRVSRKSDYIAIAEEASGDEGAEQVAAVRVEDVHGPEEPLFDHQEDKENHEPTSAATKGKRKRTKSTARKFTRPKKRSSTGSLQEERVERSPVVVDGGVEARDEEYRGSATSPIASKVPVAEARTLPLGVRHQHGVAIPTKAPRMNQQLQQANLPNGLSRNASISTRSVSELAEDVRSHAEDSVISLQCDGPPKKRRKRKSILVKRKARRVSAQSAAPDGPTRQSRRAQARGTGSPATPYREPEDEEDETYLPEEASPEPPTPAISKTSGRNTKTARSNESDHQASHRHRSTSSEAQQSSFPVTMHRLTIISALPTITEEHEANSEDELNELVSFGASRTMPNAVDVLSEVCREAVAAALSTIRTSSTGSALKRKSEALESFGKEAESSLFDLSAAVESRLLLEARVRASKRKKSEMQGRWIEVRKKREEAALRMDRVRREHWESEEQGTESWKLSESLHGVGVVMQRDTGTESESLEHLLKTVGAGVSGFEGGGVLQRVKDFNARMERMVQVLEGSGQ